MKTFAENILPKAHENVVWTEEAVKLKLCFIIITVKHGGGLKLLCFVIDVTNEFGSVSENPLGECPDISW